MKNNIHILYIDDEIINVKLFKINFSKYYNIYTAFSGIEGLEVLDKYPEIQIIISDFRMPKMNGIEFVKIAKKKYPNKKFNILTGFGITDEAQEALNKGIINNYLRKPFNIYRIKEVISEQVGDTDIENIVQ